MSPLDGSLLPPLLLAGAALLGGTVATYTYVDRSGFGWRLLEGGCTGLAALGLAGFVLAMRFGLGTASLAGSGALVASPLALLLSERTRGALLRDMTTSARTLASAIRRPRLGLVLYAVVDGAGLLLLWRVASRVMFISPDGIHTGVSHNIGDLPFHLSITNRFLWGSNFPPEHPSFAGASLTYPFLPDFLGAMFVRAGLPVREMFVSSTFLLLVTTAALMYRFTRALTGRRDAAFLAPIIALMSGGLGWWRLVGEAAQPAQHLGALLAHLPHDYTITGDNAFRWGNLVTSLLVTQRGLLFGVPLALLAFGHIWQAAFESAEPDSAPRRRMLAAGIVTGLLPLVHAHTFAVVLGVAACLAVFSRPRADWVPFFMWALALGVPQIVWLALMSNMQPTGLLAWSPGWDHGTENVFLFWFKNTGLFIPLLLAALAWRGARPLLPRRLLLFYLPFTLCFFIPNLFRLAPWIWDNIKVLIYWFIASVPLVALILARMASGAWWRRALAAAALATLTLAGALDLWRVASGAFDARIFDRQGMAFAAMISAATAPGSLVLHAPVPNHPVVLTGRRSFMGYPGHVWSHGLDAGTRESDIRRVYAGAPDAIDILARNRIDYIVAGPAERAYTPLNEPFLRRFPLVGVLGGYRLYRASPIRTAGWR